jgi:peptide/nickel transport system substrate-binding protein
MRDQAAHVSRRDALRGIAAAVLVSLLGACASPSLPVASPTRAPTAGTGGTLRIGMLGDVASLDPHQLTPPVPDVTFPVWDRLVDFDAQVKPQAALAESWDMSADGMQLRLTLRQGVEFHTGRPLTSDDIKWTLNRLQTDPVVATTGFHSQVQPLSSVDVLDRYTAVVRSEAPWPGVFGLLSIMSVADSVSLSGPSARSQAVGTGPFVFDEWQQGDHLRLHKNERYWAGGQPRVDGLYFQVFKDPQAMVTALEAGAIDVADRPPLADAVRLQNDARFRVVISSIGGTRYALLFNVLSPPCDQRQFRQALLYAVDRQRMIDTVLHGIGTPCNLPFAASSPAYDAARDQRYAFNPDRAAALVAASGVAHPTLDFNYSSLSAEWAGIAQIYQADLARIGVSLNLKPLDPISLVTELRNRSWSGLMTGIVPLGATTPIQQANDPYYSPVLSFSGFTSPMLTQLSEQLLHETEPVRQQQVYAQWSDYVLDEAWAGAVATSPPIVATTPRVHDLKYTQLEVLDYRAAWLEA